MPGSCNRGLNPSPSSGTGNRRTNGFEVNRMNSRKKTPIRPCTPSTRARKLSGMLRPNTEMAAPNTARTRTQSSIEPSWCPQVAAIL